MTGTRVDPAIRVRLLDTWRSLRDQGRLGTLLPRSESREWEIEGRRHGFVTVDYRVYRDVALPPADAAEPRPVADLVEMYWSVRTRDGRQDPDWAPAANAHVIQVVIEDVGVGDLERLYRRVVLVRRALQLGGIGKLVADGAAIALHVRGLLLGPALSAPVAIVDALAAHADVPLTVGRFEVGAADRITFTGTGAAEKAWEARGDPDELQALGERWLGHDALFRSRGAWPPIPPPDPTRPVD